MSEARDQDATAWWYLRDWLARDEQGRRILQALVTDPDAGVLALRQRLEGTQAPAQVTNNLRESGIGKFATFARADRVIMGDQYYYSDQSRHYDVDPFAAVRSATGIARLLMISGVLILLAGIAWTGYDFYNYFNDTESLAIDWYNRLAANPTLGNSTPPLPRFPAEIMATLALAFAGFVLFIVGGVMRPRMRQTQDRFVAGDGRANE